MGAVHMLMNLPPYDIPPWLAQQCYSVMYDDGDYESDVHLLKENYRNTTVEEDAAAASKGLDRPISTEQVTI